MSPLTEPLGAAEWRRQTIVSSAFAFGALAVQSGLLLAGSVVLARVLTPDAFGVFAMVVPFAVLASDFTNHSVQTILIQRATLSGDEVDGFFRLAVYGNGVVAIAMIGAGMLSSWFYGEPRVIGVTVVWAIVVFGLTITAFQEALLKRALRFPMVLSLQLAGAAVSVVVSIGAAYAGAGYWALPLQVFVMEAVRAVGVSWVSEWRPRWKPRGSVSIEPLRASWRGLVLNRAASWLNEQPDLLAVGRLGGASALGLYDTSRRWAWYPFVEPFFTTTHVAVASLSRMAADPTRFERFAIRAVMLMLTAWLAGNVMSIEGGVLTQLFSALIGSVVISVASTLIGWVLPGKN